MEPEAFLHEHDDSDDSEMPEEERWRQLEKWAFRLRTVIQELLLDQITLLLDDIQESVVRIHRQKERFRKGQDCSAPPPVSHVSGGGAAGGQSSRKTLQEKRMLERRMFEMLQELIADVTATSDAAASFSLQIPKSSPVYKKAYLVGIDEVLTFFRLSDWMAESASFANELLDEVTKLCCQPKLIRAALDSLNVKVEDFLNLPDEEEDGLPRYEAEEQRNEGAAVQTEFDVGESDNKAESKSEVGQGRESMTGLIEAAMESLKVNADGDLINLKDEDGPPGNGAEEQSNHGAAEDPESEVGKGAGKKTKP